MNMMMIPNPGRGHSSKRRACIDEGVKEMEEEGIREGFTTPNKLLSLFTKLFPNSGRSNKEA